MKLKEGSGLSIDRLSEYVVEKTGKEKAPGYYKIVSEFPMTGSGKVQKFRLAEMAGKEIGSDRSKR